MEEQAKMMGKFRASGDSYSAHEANKITKRNRQPLSCLPCRQRKLKCDRAHPCGTCVKRDDQGSCLYGKEYSTSKRDGASRVKAQDRLQQLENLVMQMVDTAGSRKSDLPRMPLATSTTGKDDAPPGDGRLEQDGKYVGSTHWAALLENIHELRSAINGEGSQLPEEAERGTSPEMPDQQILFGGSRRTLSIQQILLQFMPPRIYIDRMVSTYFNAKYMVLPCIHTHHFQRQYDRFWQDTEDVDPLWLSILCSICCISSQLTAATTSVPSEADEAKTQVESFLVASAHCLILGGYTRPRPNVVEALAMYAQCKYNGSLDPSREVAMVLAILIHLAYRMAYHRDPDHFSHFSVFEGEMRRRVWMFCRQFDLMVSFQLGLPNNIPLDSWDTEPPRNLVDADFDEDTKVLPPSRPEKDATQILYFIIKSRLMANFGRICNHALSFKNSSKEEIMALDAEVRQTFSTIPDILRIRPMAKSLADPSYLVMVRLNCKFLYEKSLLVLHRRYMAQGYDVSRQACIDSAMAICSCFADMHPEFQPGGRLHLDRWMLSSFTMNDFLLAVMVLCLALSQWRRRNINQQRIEIYDPIVQPLAMLHTCCTICQERGATSIESRCVATGLRAMLDKLPPPPSFDTTRVAPIALGGGGGGGGSGNISDLSTYYPSTTLPPSHPTTIAPPLDSLSLSDGTLPHVPAGTLPNNSINDNNKTSSSLDLDLNLNLDLDFDPNFDLGPFENFLEDTKDVDWQYVDQYLVNLGRADEGYAGNDVGEGVVLLNNAPNTTNNNNTFINRDGGNTSAAMPMPMSFPTQPQIQTQAPMDMFPEDIIGLPPGVMTLEGSGGGPVPVPPVPTQHQHQHQHQQHTTPSTSSTITTTITTASTNKVGNTVTREEEERAEEDYNKDGSSSSSSGGGTFPRWQFYY